MPMKDGEPDGRVIGHRRMRILGDSSLENQSVQAAGKYFQVRNAISRDVTL